LNILSGTTSTKNQQTAPVEEFDNERPPIDRIPVVGYQGYRPTYMNLVKKLKSTATDGFYEPTKQEKDLAHVMEHTEQRLDLNKPVPCVGYTGFIAGQKAKNVHGRNYQNIAIESRLRYTK